MENKKVRLFGSIFGLMCGDAVGTTVEFRPYKTFKPVTDMIGGGVFNLNAGEWTDDSSQALCMLISLITKDGFVPEDIMNRFVSWKEDGYMSSNGTCFDIGMTTSTAINRFKQTGYPLSGLTDETSCGNGCLMRLAPIPMFYNSTLNDAVIISGLSSQLTHGHDECIDASRYFGKLIWLALNGFSKQEILSRVIGNNIGIKKGVVSKPLYSIIKGDYKKKNPPEIRGKGYVIDTLESALWAFYKTDNFVDGLLKVVNLGDDADTTGAVYGQLAGAYYGINNIPKKWIDIIAKKEKVESMVEQLIRMTIKPFDHYTPKRIRG